MESVSTIASDGKPKFVSRDHDLVPTISQWQCTLPHAPITPTFRHLPDVK